MPDTSYLVAAVLVAAAVTWALRALPFAALNALRSSATVRELSARMPAGVMVILLCYCLRDLPVTHPARLLAPLVALAVTVGVHVWRRSALVSIVGGTLVYVVLANAVHLR
jgi:branched-subunit amino acid transport protein AzlD